MASNHHVESDGGRSPSAAETEEVESMLDAFVRAEGSPEAVQLCGGEPTPHRQILDMPPAGHSS